MAQSANNNQGIINSFSLIDFARKYGKMQVGDFVNEKTGEQFKSCIFTKLSEDGKEKIRTFAHFSSKMGVLTPAEISQRKDSLQVAQLASGNYVLCNAGENAWEDVDLGF